MSDFHVRLEHTGRGSNKFWEAQQNGTVVTTRWGRIGTSTNGQSKDFSFALDTDATAYIHAKIREKIRKGYARVSMQAHPHCHAGDHEWVRQASRRPVTMRCTRCGLERFDPCRHEAGWVIVRNDGERSHQVCRFCDATRIVRMTTLTDHVRSVRAGPAPAEHATPAAPARRRRFSDDD